MLVAILLIVVVAFVPAIFYTFFLRLLDLFEKEPLWLIVTAFVWGAIPAVIFAGATEFAGATVLYSGVGIEPDAVNAITAVVGAPVLEELGKAFFLAILIFAFRRQIDSPIDGFVIGATVGLGFAASENVVYLLSAFADGGVGGVVVLTFLRIILLGFAHAFFTGVTGFGFSYARLGRGAWKVLGPILGLVGGMSLHALWNGSLTFVGGGIALLFVLVFHWGLVVGMFVAVGFLLARERRWMWGELSEEVQHGLVTPDEVRRTCSVWGRIGSQLGALFTGGPGSLRAKERFYRDLSALALCKHNLRTLQDDRKGADEIQTIRARLQAERAAAYA